ncbi:hypothetical protein PoB_007609800 [Plakobranchus ocellatus]|uniref:Uncharacterized protein n=1 Tax=Plakobranchus ocellatus TaxID=259542 RepID=A0AAV4DZ99_9GAST|nr:hypothetical protein PoB_007609800 [Plakobranchus ocellatus]
MATSDIQFPLPIPLCGGNILLTTSPFHPALWQLRTYNFPYLPPSVVVTSYWQLHLSTPLYGNFGHTTSPDHPPPWQLLTDNFPYIVLYGNFQLTTSPTYTPLWQLLTYNFPYSPPTKVISDIQLSLLIPIHGNF